MDQPILAPQAQLSIIQKQIAHALSVLHKRWNTHISNIKVYEIYGSVFSRSGLSTQVDSFGFSDELNPIKAMRTKEGSPSCRGTQIRRIHKYEFAIGGYTDDEHFKQILFVKDRQYFKIYKLLYRLQPKKKAVKPILDEVLFSDIINHTIGFLDNVNIFRSFGVKPRRGILFEGPPGNGKSMMVDYIKKTCHKKEIKTITSSDIEHLYKNGDLLNAFTGADIIIFDDVDIAYFNRKSAKAQIACDMLSCMDGAEKDRHGCVWLFTTNEDVIAMDPAFVRPGRIDKRYKFPLPTKDLRLRLIETWSPILLEHINKENLVSQSNGFSFAEIDAIKTNMVSGFYIDKLGWDVDRSVKLVQEYRDAVCAHTKEVGFKPVSKSNRAVAVVRTSSAISKELHNE